MLIYLQTIETDEEKSKFEEIYRTYRGLMYHVAFERMHHEQDAEDAVHHVFMKIAENIKIIEPVSPRTKQLVVTMVNNHVTDVFRSRGRHPTTAFDDESLSRLSTNTPEGEYLLAECILKLPEQQRRLPFPLWSFMRENISEQNILFYTACWHWKAFALDIIQRRGYNDFVNLLNH